MKYVESIFGSSMISLRSALRVLIRLAAMPYQTVL